MVLRLNTVYLHDAKLVDVFISHVWIDFIVSQWQCAEKHIRLFDKKKIKFQKSRKPRSK